jgi:hypothetical protein
VIVSYAVQLFSHKSAAAPTLARPPLADPFQPPHTRPANDRHPPRRRLCPYLAKTPRTSVYAGLRARRILVCGSNGRSGQIRRDPRVSPTRSACLPPHARDNRRKFARGIGATRSLVRGRLWGAKWGRDSRSKTAPKICPFLSRNVRIVTPDSRGKLRQFLL